MKLIEFATELCQSKNFDTLFSKTKEKSIDAKENAKQYIERREQILTGNAALLAQGFIAHLISSYQWDTCRLDINHYIDEQDLYILRDKVLKNLQVLDLGPGKADIYIKEVIINQGKEQITRHTMCFRIIPA